MVQAKLSPRRETLRLRIDRTSSERTSRSCPSPAGEDSAASRAIPVKADSLSRGGKLGSIGKRSRFADIIFAICSPHVASVLPSDREVKWLCRTAIYAQVHAPFGA